jgi:lipid II:glycine glycyltransferase (peptidoglycan interpeptide bridge formation enzyme)
LSSVKNTPPINAEANGYSFAVSNGGHDPTWDSFLSEHESGHHVQTSLWSTVKAINGWKTERIKVTDGDTIVGGAQVLIRDVRYLGRVGYVPKGPVVKNSDQRIVNALIDRLRQLAITQRMRVLFVQPAANGVVESQLDTQDFVPCPIETAASATILVDLAPDLNEILARMTKSMRNGVRRGQKREITVREGNKNDLPTFHRLLSATSQRRGFSTFDQEYFRRMWEILEPSGCIKLFLAELDGEAVSAQFCIPFGDTVVAKQIGWSGEHARRHPNEALDWFTIRWAKENGYKFYDLEGIERPAAQAIISGQPLPQAFADSPTAYKLRLGGEVKLNPGAYCFVSNTVLRTLYNRVGFQFARWPIFQKAVSRFRTS